MNLIRTRQNRAELELPKGSELSALVGMPSQLVIVTFRGAQVRVLADHDVTAQRARSMALGPVPDLDHLELLSGAGEAPDWPRPVMLHAVIEARLDPLLAVQRASRWASYAARLALVPEERVSDRALLEAGLRGVWVLAMDKDQQLRVASTGERGPVAGSVRGLSHRLLDELVWAALEGQGAIPGAGFRPAATR